MITIPAHIPINCLFIKSFLALPIAKTPIRDKAITQRINLKS